MKGVQELVFEKEIEFNDKLFFLLTDKNGSKRVVEAISYYHYKLESGTIVKCKLKKRGCSGEEITDVFHPYYEVGRTYPFTVSKIGKLGNTQNYVLGICDEMHNNFTVVLHKPFVVEPGSIVNCKLIYHKKGILKFDLVL